MGSNAAQLRLLQEVLSVHNRNTLNAITGPRRDYRPADRATGLRFGYGWTCRSRRAGLCTAAPRLRQPCGQRIERRAF